MGFLSPMDETFSLDSVEAGYFTRIREREDIRLQLHLRSISIVTKIKGEKLLSSFFFAFKVKEK